MCVCAGGSQESSAEAESREDGSFGEPGLGGRGRRRFG